jgi:histidinol-phosphatase
MKADGTPVTAADLEVEDALMSILRAERPTDAILSEETGVSGGNSGRRWIIDPIDGTVHFAKGGFGWSTFVALEEKCEVVLGVINQPHDQRRYWAVRGGGTRAALTERGLPVASERPVRVSEVSALADARFTAVEPIDTPALQALRRTATWQEPTPDFLIDLLEGRIDVLLSQGGAIWDHAAEVVIVEEAGGRFHDPAGGHRLDLHGGTYTNSALAAQVGALLSRF